MGFDGQVISLETLSTNVEILSILPVVRLLGLGLQVRTSYLSIVDS